MSKPSLFIPLVVFVAIVGLFYLGFGLDERGQLPSALLGKDFPEFSAPDLYAPDAIITREDLLGAPALVNVWATWCPTCKAEHEVLMDIAASATAGTAGLRIVGLNYKDDRGKALQWLAEFGNPYAMVLSDTNGLLGVELGVYGAPETFLLNPQGQVIYKRVGDVNQRIWEEEIKPRLAQLEAAG